MTRGLLVALGVVLALPTAGRADDIAPLYPDAATFAFGIDVKAIAASPLGKKVIGNDKPFDATRKLLKVMFPDGIFPVTEKALKPLESVTNQLERVTILGNANLGSWPPGIAVYLEGAIDEGEYFRAAEAVAKEEGKEFATEKVGERKMFVVGKDHTVVYGLHVSRSVFLLATKRVLIDEVVEKHAGKKQATIQPALAAMLKRVKPAETPIWLVVGELELLKGITGGIATIALKDDADFQLEVHLDEESLAKTVATLFDQLVEYFPRGKTPQDKLWDAARITVNRDNTTVTAIGSIPAKVLAEEYAKQK